jgi:hypothetical protein
MQGRFTWETLPIDAEPLTDAVASVVGSWWMDGRIPWHPWPVHGGWMGGYRGIHGQFTRFAAQEPPARADLWEQENVSEWLRGRYN